ncbi:hypothetical protein ACFUS2_14465 [[Kitasatospora] papulosa]|uniref:hypothetical protein n=1 Tax=Streptomyces TaxID=1883 RepID=UPI0004BE2548|nr:MULTISPECIES: hypothetical protein [Streptomyces]MEE1775973.1 hypothetical protein [Streptomyces sp. JV181]MYT56271.1 hypothetical protein [Streptomyces sp. SID7834]
MTAYAAYAAYAKTLNSPAVSGVSPAEANSSATEFSCALPDRDVVHGCRCLRAGEVLAAHDGVHLPLTSI